MGKIIAKILGWLLFHANREHNTAEFYAIKNRIVEKYGIFAGFDVQHLPGVRCNVCDGHGNFALFYGGYDNCWHCWRGWYKLPTWVVLFKYKVGNYRFHQPIEKMYSEEAINEFLTAAGRIQSSNAMFIEGYIDHFRSKYADMSYMILGTLFDCRGYWTRWIKYSGQGWYCYWWKPRNWVNNIMHIIKYGVKAIPIQDLKRSMVK